MKKAAYILLAVITILIIVVGTNGYYQTRRLFRAIDMDDVCMAQDAISKGAFVNMPYHVWAYPSLTPINHTPLIAACEKGNESIIRLLVSYGANVNKIDKCSGETPLLAALEDAKSNRFALALYLIAEGADIHAVQMGIESPFQQSLYITEADPEHTREASMELLTYLLNHGVDRTVYGQDNALTFAARYGNMAAVEYMLSNGYVGIDDTNHFGQTALHIAVINNDADMVLMLLANGSDTSIADSSGKLPIDYAQENLVVILTAN